MDIAVVFLCKREPPFPLVVLGWTFLHVSLLLQRMDLVRRIGAGYAEKIRKLADRRLVERMDHIHGKDLHCGQAALPFPDDGEYPFVKMQTLERFRHNLKIELKSGCVIGSAPVKYIH